MWACFLDNCDFSKMATPFLLMNSENNLFLGPIYANWKSVLIQRVGVDFCSRELVLHCISLVIGGISINFSVL